MGGRGSSSRVAKSRNRLTAEEYEKYSKNVIYGRDSVTRKQAGVLYAAYKRGDLDATKEQMNMTYGRYASHSPSPTTDSATSDVVNKLQVAVSAAANSDYDAAYRAFQTYLDAHYAHFKDSTYPDDR